MGIPTGRPWPTANLLAVVKLRFGVPVELALLDNVNVPVPAPESTVVPEGIPEPLTASPATTVLGNVPLLSETLAEPDVVDTLSMSRFGPMFVNWPQSVIWLDAPMVAHQMR